MRNKKHVYFDLFMEQFPDLNKEAKDFTRSFLIFQEYDKRDFLFNGGLVQKELCYVSQGLLRKYYINEKGNKITTSFISENGYATDYPSFLRQIPSKFYMECLEPAVIIKMPYDKLQEAYSNYKDSEMYGRLMAEKVLTRETDRVESFLFQNAEERYLSFIDNNKELLNRISLSHLASYLGMERQSLSRIRSKLAKN